MTGYFNSVPKIDVSDVIPGVEADMRENVCTLDMLLSSIGSTHDDLLRFVEDVEQHCGGRVSWDMPYSFEEFARRVRSGEDLSDGL